MMSRLTVLTATGMLLAGPLATTAGAAARSTPPAQNKLQCFSGTADGYGYGGTCTLMGHGAKTTAILANSDNNSNGDYSGVYVNKSTLYGATLQSVTQLGYTYSGNITPTPGDLSLNIQINVSGVGPGNTSTDPYAYIDAAYCPGTLGLVNVITDSTCGIYFLAGGPFANWAALVSAYPNATIDSGGAIIVAERTPGTLSATWTVSNVVFGQPGKPGKPGN